MPYILADLIVNRVDLVDEGANSAAFIEVFKRKEPKEPMELSEILSKMKPEHAEKVSAEMEALREEVRKAREELDTATTTISEKSAELDETKEALANANAEIETLKAAPETCSCDGEAGADGVCKSCGKTKKNLSFDDAEVLKSMPESVREEFLKMRAQKEAAEEQVRKAAEEKLNAEAVAKAATMKSLPVEQETLVEIIKSADPKVVDVLSTVAAAINDTVLGEVGSVGKGRHDNDNGDAWSQIESKAAEIAKRDNVTKQKAIGIAIKENPELYREYLNGGAN